MSEKLKPCPFCGKDEANFTTDKWGNYYVECEYCGAQTNPYDDKEIVIEEWQTRPIEDELRKRIAELKAWINKFIAEGEYLSLLNGLVNGDSDWGNLVADYWKESEDGIDLL